MAILASVPNCAAMTPPACWCWSICAKNWRNKKKSRLSSINSNFNICDEHDVFVGAEPLFGERQRSPHGDATPTRQNHTKKITRSAEPDFKLFNGGTAPENLTGEIRRFNPSHLIMIDAVELGKRPGTMALLDLKRIENTAFLTHKLPMKLMLDYLAAEMNFAAVFIGIQPRSLDFGVPVSKTVAQSCERLAEMIWSATATLSFP